MAPEQVVHSGPPDCRTDIYSLGGVAYFLLTGRAPFSGDSAMEVMIAHTRDPVVPPRQVRPEIPSDLEQVVLRCLSKLPADRYSDTQSLGLAFAECADAANWSPAHAAEWWRTCRQTNASAGGLSDSVTAVETALDPLDSGVPTLPGSGDRRWK
jgi:serine/threonine-protein kinase